MPDLIDNGTIVPVVMAGGVGSRLWPMSREDKPKQFLSPLGGSTLLQRTIERLMGNGNPLKIKTIVIITNTNFAEQTKEQLVGFKNLKFEYVFEPCMRNTAPALAAATLFVEKNYPGSVIAMLAADHYVLLENEFRDALKLACEVAKNSTSIVTFGIKPNRPETGYGYIKYDSTEGDVCDVKAFVEKPDVETAISWLESGNYLWNSGKFIFNSEAMLKAFKEFQPDILAGVQNSIDLGIKDNDSLYLDVEAYGSCESISIDYAIMEKSKDLKLVPADIGWFDVGSWEQISIISELLEEESASRRTVTKLDSKDTYTLTSDRNIVTIGTRNLIIVDTKDALLVADKSRTQEVKTIYENLKKDNPEAVFSSFSSMSLPDQAKYNKDRIIKWLLEDALPFWLKNANDLSDGGIVESFTRQGDALIEEPRRVRVLARQIYAFSHIACLEWQVDTKDFLDRNFSYLVKNAWGDQDGWVHKLDQNGTQLDTSVYTYDQAFALLSFAWLYKATNNPSILLQIEKTISFIDTNLNGCGSDGLLSEMITQDQPETNEQPRKHANPHMHMLEAYMALYSATLDVEFLDRAGKIIDLFKEKIFDQKHSVVLELFDQNMDPVSDKNGQWVEPGHMYEWAHLLATYDELSGNDLQAYSKRLIATAEAFSCSPITGLVLDKFDLNWNVLNDTSRLWPQLERLRALVSLKKNGLGSLDGEIENAVDVIFNSYLSGTLKGLWDDCLDSNGHLVSTKVPQSTFYHLVAAFSDYLSMTNEC